MALARGGPATCVLEAWGAGAQLEVRL